MSADLCPSYIKSISVELNQIKQKTVICNYWGPIFREWGIVIKTHKKNKMTNKVNKKILSYGLSYINEMNNFL
jgi:hypothetical protein